MSATSPAILWYRHDLRLSDNPALQTAFESGRPIIPLFIYDAGSEGNWTLGAASRWWLHHSLTSLNESWKELGSRLVLRKGAAKEVLARLCEATGAGCVYWNRRYEPAVVERDTQIKKALVEAGVEVKSFNGSLLQSPLKVSNKSGTPFKVFTPFWKHIRGLNTRRPNDAPDKVEVPRKWPESELLEDWKLLPEIGWDKGFYDAWSPGEKGAWKALDEFAHSRAIDYEEKRDLPAVNGVSRLSPHLRFGELSPNQVWHRIDTQRHEPYARQIAWREFAYHLMFHFPDTPEKPLHKQFEKFSWKRSRKKLEAWQKGQTGFPIVDAGMRELWHTGWMHNRVRMIVGSFLVKHLLQPWQDGAAWFWDTLVDADLANNTLGWQWVAGCGADAAPYFRIFNPITQGERFDGDGTYTKKWVPELKELPGKYLFQPWEAPAEVLERAGVDLGGSYPKPIVTHKEGRESALNAYAVMKGN